MILFNQPVNRKNFTLYLQFFFLLLIIATFPLKHKYNSMAIIGFAAVWLLHGNLKERIRCIIKDRNFVLYGLFYLLLIVSLLYSSNLKYAFTDLQARLPLIVFPLIIGSTSLLKNNNFFIIMKVFVAMLLVSCLYCHSSVFMLWSGSGEAITQIFSEKYSSANLTSFIKIHPVYFAMYLCFAVFFLAYMLTFEPHALKKHEKIIFAACALYFTFFIFHTSARMVFIEYVFGGISFAFFYLRKTKNIKKFLTVTTLIVFCATLFMFGSEYNRKRLFSVFKPLDNTASRWNSDTTSPRRIILWRNAADVFMKNRLTGVGIGDVHEELNNAYLKNGFMLGQHYNYNTHNQYIEFFVSLGIVGGVFFLFIVYLSFKMAITSQSFLYFSFLVIVSMTMLTENILNTQKGIVFFALFNSLLFYFCTLKKEVDGKPNMEIKC